MTCAKHIFVVVVVYLCNNKIIYARKYGPVPANTRRVATLVPCMLSKIIKTTRPSKTTKATNLIGVAPTPAGQHGQRVPALLPVGVGLRHAVRVRPHVALQRVGRVHHVHGAGLDDVLTPGQRQGAQHEPEHALHAAGGEGEWVF